MKKLKVFHGMMDVAGQASYDVEGLKQNSIKADLVVWEKNKFAYIDYKSLNISRNRLLYSYSFMKMLLFSLYAIPKYNIFHFHYSRSLIPLNLDLPILKLLNKKVFMEYHGSDIRWNYYREMPKYWPVDYLPRTSTRSLYARRIIDNNIDGYILHDSELKKHLPSNKNPIYYIPLKVNVDRFTPKYPSVDETKPLIVHAPSNALFKGTTYVLKAIDSLSQELNFDFTLVEGKTQKEAIEIFSKADIIIDQFYAGTYGVFTVESMAMGKPVICYLTEDMIDEFPDDLPIVNANIENLSNVLRDLIINPSKRHEIGVNSRKYAENYHDYRYVTKALKEVYEGTYLPKGQKESFEYIKSLREG